eukprot:169348_1
MLTQPAKRKRRRPKAFRLPIISSWKKYLLVLALVVLNICIIAYYIPSLLTRDELSITGSFDGDFDCSRITDFVESPVGWIIENRDADRISIRSSIYITTLRLTPKFKRRGLMFDAKLVRGDEKHAHFFVSQNLSEDSTDDQLSPHTLVVDVRSHVIDRTNALEVTLSFANPKRPERRYSQCRLKVSFDPLDFKFNIDEWTGADDHDNRLGKGGFGAVHEVTHKAYNVKAALKKRQLSQKMWNETAFLKEMWEDSAIVDMYSYAVRPSNEVPHNSRKGLKHREGRSYTDDEGLVLLEAMDGDSFKLARGLSHMWDDNEFADMISEPEFRERLENIIASAMRAWIMGLLQMKKHNYCHLDVKPANLLFKEIEFFERYEFKVTDFGTVSKFINEKNGKHFRYTKTVGTYCYRAPEKEYDCRADIYSLGAISFQMLTQRYAFDGPRSMKLEKYDKKGYAKRVRRYTTIRECPYCFEEVEVGKEARSFIEACMVKSPSERLTLEEALKHPWIANSVREKSEKPSDQPRTE